MVHLLVYEGDNNIELGLVVCEHQREDPLYDDQYGLDSPLSTSDYFRREKRSSLRGTLPNFVSKANSRKSKE